MGLVLVTPPAEEPLGMGELKTHLKIEPDETLEDGLLTTHIMAARELGERELRRALVQQQWRWTLDAFPASSDAVLRPPLPPLLSVDSIKYLDTAGVEQTLAASAYVVDTVSEPGRIQLVPGQSWPSTQDVLNAVRILFTAGWAGAEKVPEGIKNGMKLLIGTWFRNRESTISGTIIGTVPDGVERCWAPWRMREFR